MIGLDGYTWERLNETNMGWNWAKRFRYKAEMETYNHTVPSNLAVLTGQEPQFKCWHYDDVSGCDKLFSIRDVKEPLLWDLLESVGKLRFWIGFPLITEVRHVKGIMFGSYVTHGELVFPSWLKTDIPNPSILHAGETVVSLLNNLNWILETASKYTRFNWDLMMVYVSTPDAVHHLNSEFNQTKKPVLTNKEASKVMDALDYKLSKFIEKTKFKTCIVYSDHGAPYSIFHHPTGILLIESCHKVKTKQKPHILDLYPTILASLGLEDPKAIGENLITPNQTKNPETSHSFKEKIKQRLRKLGYL